MPSRKHRWFGNAYQGKVDPLPHDLGVNIAKESLKANGKMSAVDFGTSRARSVLLFTGLFQARADHVRVLSHTIGNATT